MCWVDSFDGGPRVKNLVLLSWPVCEPFSRCYQPGLKKYGPVALRSFCLRVVARSVCARWGPPPLRRENFLGVGCECPSGCGPCGNCPFREVVWIGSAKACFFASRRLGLSLLAWAYAIYGVSTTLCVIGILSTTAYKAFLFAAWPNKPYTPIPTFKIDTFFLYIYTIRGAFL